jgi:hypothetical protein
MISKNISKTIICLVFVLSSPLLRAQTDSDTFPHDCRGLTDGKA